MAAEIIVSCRPFSCGWLRKSFGARRNYFSFYYYSFKWINKWITLQLRKTLQGAKWFRRIIKFALLKNNYRAATRIEDAAIFARNRPWRGGKRIRNCEKWSEITHRCGSLNRLEGREWCVAEEIRELSRLPVRPIDSRRHRARNLSRSVIDFQVARVYNKRRGKITWEHCGTIAPSDCFLPDAFEDTIAIVALHRIPLSIVREGNKYIFGYQFLFHCFSLHASPIILIKYNEAMKEIVHSKMDAIYKVLKLLTFYQYKTIFFNNIELPQNIIII